MDKYQPLEHWLGSGTFGDVFAAIHKPTGEVVAIKQLKRRFDGSAVEPEFQCYCESGFKHPNIVDFREFFMMNESDMNFVFEFMEGGTLLDVMRERVTMFTEKDVRNMCFQILRGLDYMHKKGYFHRDLKPANLLVKEGVVKIGDLGSARKIDSCEPLEPYVTTRWYRAPEVMLRSGSYGPKVDMWAVGVIMAELFNLSPLFASVNGLHPIARICSVIGTPTSQLRFPMLYRQHLSSVIPSASASAVSLIASLLSWDPCRRPTAEEALRHPFFDSYRIPPAIASRPAQHIARNNWNLPPRLQKALLV